MHVPDAAHEPFYRDRGLERHPSFLRYRMQGCHSGLHGGRNEHSPGPTIRFERVLMRSTDLFRQDPGKKHAGRLVMQANRTR
jgi:hypothetical protein